MGKHRTPSQKAAIATVQAAAKDLIAKIDAHHDPKWKEFTAFFHLDRWRTSDFMECRTIYSDGTEENFPIRISSKLFSTVSNRM